MVQIENQESKIENAPPALGTLYGLGVGPGDPEWLTVKAARLLAQARHVCVPKARIAADSVALDIARTYLRPDAAIHEITFPMTADEKTLHDSWAAAARTVYDLLAAGHDVCFLTLGDAQLYSTYIYLLQALRRLDPAVHIVTVPGITAFSAVAALTNTPVGIGKNIVTIVPASDDLVTLRRALDAGGTVVLMKVGKRLPQVLEELESRHLLAHAVFVAHAGMPNQVIETDLAKLRNSPEATGYLSTMIIQANQKQEAGSKKQEGRV